MQKSYPPASKASRDVANISTSFIQQIMFFLRKVPKEQSMFDVPHSNPDPGPAPQLNPALGAM